MDIERQKELILEYVQQYETDQAVGVNPNRTKRALLDRFNRKFKPGLAYTALLEEGAIHELGNGSRGNPIIVVLGPPPIKPTALPVPWSYVPLLALAAFLDDLKSTYEANGWPADLLDYGREIAKAFETYAPGRPY